MRGRPILARIDDGKGSPRFRQSGRGFDYTVESRTGFCTFVRYIHRNPVRRGLVEGPEQWTWSSVRWWMGIKEGEVECDDPLGDPRPWEAWKGFE